MTASLGNRSQDPIESSKTEHYLDRVGWHSIDIDYVCVQAYDEDIRKYLDIDIGRPTKSALHERNTASYPQETHSWFQSRHC